MASLQPKSTPHLILDGLIAIMQTQMHDQLQIYQHIRLFTIPTRLYFQLIQTYLFSRTKMDKQSKTIQISIHILALQFLRHPLPKHHHLLIIIPKWEIGKPHDNIKTLCHQQQFHQPLPCQWPLDGTHLQAI